MAKNFKKEKTEEWFGLVWLNMVFNTNFNNIFDISWRSVLFIGGENRKLVTGTDCIGSCKSNYYMNTTPPPPPPQIIFKNEKTEEYVHILYRW